MIDRPCDTWISFERRLDEFFSKRPLDRDRFVFRGQADSNWPLTTTLDRFLAKYGIADREAARNQLLEVFEKQASALGETVRDSDAPTLQLIARHHGLPSTIMDWTRSPYIAAFFGFRDAFHDNSTGPEKVAVWCLDLQEAVVPFGDDVLIVDDFRANRFIPRAIEQQSVFIDLRYPFDLAALPSDSLRKFMIPANERNRVLARLEHMGINERSLFRSLEGAANVASWRVRAMLKKEP